MAIDVEGFRSWHRIEPDARQLTVAKGARACLGDPLYLLAQQWRAGEFQHEEGGVPIVARTAISEQAITSFKDAQGVSELFTTGPRADELLAEPPQPPARAMPQRAAVLLGRSIEITMSNLPKTERAAWRALQRRFAASPSAGDRLTRMRVRTKQTIIDGARILAAVKARDAELANGLLWRRLVSWAVEQDDQMSRQPLAVERPLPTISFSRNISALRGEITGVNGPFGSVPGSLRLGRANLAKFPFPSEASRERLPPQACSFDLSAFAHRGTLTFGDAASFALRCGEADRLDWTRLTTPSHQPAAETRRAQTVPTRLSFPGKPPERFWSVSEAATDWDAQGGGPTDLARAVAGLLLAEGSPDWFVFPVTASRNALVELLEVKMTTGFPGKVHQPVPAQQNGLILWRSVADAAANVVLTLAEAEPVTGPVLERTLLKAEEATNCLWLVERILPDANGRGRMRTDVRDTPDAGEDDGRPSMRYHLQVSPPANWFPFRYDREAGFVRASFAVGVNAGNRPEGLLGSQVERVGFGRVPAAGLLIERKLELGRAPDGTPRIWVRRAARTATAETQSSGLAYDLLVLPSEG